jgi:hypothetical protein
MKNLLRVVTVTLSASILMSQTVYRYTNRFQLVDKAVLLPETAFDKPRIVKLAYDFAREEAGRASIARLLIGTNLSELGDAIGREAFHPTGIYALGSIEWPQHPIARVFVIGGSIGISYKKDPRGLAEQWFLQGDHDPTEMLVAGTTYTLLHFYLPDKIKGLWDVEFFFIASGQPSISEAKELLAGLQGLAGTKSIALSIRTDSWFPGTSGYPKIYPFDPKHVKPDFHDILPANPREYYRAPEVGCHVLSEGKAGCGGYNARP